MDDDVHMRSYQSKVLRDHFNQAIRGAKENGWTEAQIARQFRGTLAEVFGSPVESHTFGTPKSEPVLLIDCIDAGKRAELQPMSLDAGMAHAMKENHAE